jgi:hypothetical protein
MWALVDRELSVNDLAEHVGKLAPRYRIRVAVRSAWRRTRHRPDDQRLGRLSFKPLPSTTPVMPTAIAKAAYE